MEADLPRTSRYADDLAFIAYVGTLVTALLAGGALVLVLDLEGETKLAAATAFLLPAVMLSAVVAHAVRTPLHQGATTRDL
jgi:hypothetical protein